MACRSTLIQRSLAVLAITASGPALSQDADQTETAKPRLIETPNVFRSDWRDTRYGVPDLAPDLILIPRLKTSFLTIRPGIELIFDQDSFDQDDASLAQVGEQSDKFLVRSASLNLNGELGPGERFTYKVGVAFNGFDAEADDNWVVTDFNVAFVIKRLNTRVRVGQMREDIGYEVIGSTSTMPQSERVLAPFTSPINFGFKATHMLGSSERGTLTIGVFKDDWGDGDGKLALSARATMLAIDEPDRFLHVGASIRRGDVGSVVRYNGRPGISGADDFVDTGEFSANSTINVGLEAHYSHGPWSVIAEYAAARPDVPVGNDPVFRGYYVLGSWVLTGERRPYDRQTGVVKRLTPNGRWGAPELVARYAVVDLSSQAIDGGRYERIELGANWWATTRWKFGVLYGHIRLDRFGETGVTNSFLTRLQWVY